MTTAHWRQRNAVLVTEAHSMGGIAAIRSLGRAGYPVYACASERNALGLASRYATGALVAPEYHDSQFIPWLRDVIARNNIKAIVPSEGLLLAIRSKLAEFAHLIPVSQRDDVLYRGLSKADLFVELTMPGNDAAHAANLPPSVVVADAAHVPDEGTLAALGAPLYIKVDACYGDGEASGTVYRATTAAVARERLIQALSQFRKALVQGHVPGQGVGAFFLVWDGKVVAEFMHRRIHEVPHTGGASSFRESWWHQGIRDDALAKLTCLRWNCVAMMEYRWDPATDRYFIEMAFSVPMNVRGRYSPALTCRQRSTSPVITSPTVTRCSASRSSTCSGKPHAPRSTSVGSDCLSRGWYRWAIQRATRRSSSKLSIMARRNATRTRVVPLRGNWHGAWR